VARVIGSLAEVAPADGTAVSAMLVLKENKYTLLSAADLHMATPLASTMVVQRPCFRFDRPIGELLAAVGRIFAFEGGDQSNVGGGGGKGDGEGGRREEGCRRQQGQEEGRGARGGEGALLAAGDQVTAADATAAGHQVTAADETAAGGQVTAADVTAAGDQVTAAADRVSVWRVHDLVTISHHPLSGMVTLEWEADPLSDTVADAISAILLQLQASELALPTAADNADGLAAGPGDETGQGLGGKVVGDETGQGLGRKVVGGESGLGLGGQVVDGESGQGVGGKMGAGSASSAGAELRFALRVLRDHFGSVEPIGGLGGAHSAEGESSADRDKSADGRASVEMDGIAELDGPGRGRLGIDGHDLPGPAFVLVKQDSGAVAPAAARGPPQCWVLTVAGHRVVLHGASLPFQRVECGSEYAVKRLHDVLDRARKAFRPVEG
jgi:hypothetical protein